MKPHIIKLQNPFTQTDEPLAADIYVEEYIDGVLYYGIDISMAKHYTDRNTLRKHMNRVATQFMHELGYLRSTKPKAIPINE
jgi:hypothetical protein